MHVNVCGLHSVRVCSAFFTHVSFHLTKGHSHTTCGAPQEVKKYHHMDSAHSYSAAAAAAAAHVAVDSGG